MSTLYGREGGGGRDGAGGMGRDVGRGEECGDGRVVEARDHVSVKHNGRDLARPAARRGASDAAAGGGQAWRGEWAGGGGVGGECARTASC